MGMMLKNLVHPYIQSTTVLCDYADEPTGTSSDETGAVVGVVLSVVIFLSVGMALATVFIVWRKRKVAMLSNVTQNTSIHLPPVSC